MAKKTDLIGEVLQGTYRVERLLGEGGMGAVYEASHLRLSQRFAVKVLAPHGAEHGDAVARFRREAEITSAIGHPHIVLVIDFNYTHDGNPYIIMELLEGEDLYARIQRHERLDLPTTASIFRQIASAVQAAHQKGVIHRDLKSKNVFLCRRGETDDFVKVVDFGISKMLGAESVLTKANEVLGTPCYMAPEQIDPQVTVDLRADIYSMGVILYEMLAGHPPFHGVAIHALLYQIVHRPPPPLRGIRPDIPASVSALIERALSKKPEQRFNSMRRFWREFNGALVSEDLQFYEPTEDRTENWLRKTIPPPNAASAAVTEAVEIAEGQGSSIEILDTADIEAVADAEMPADTVAVVPAAALPGSPAGSAGTATRPWGKVIIGSVIGAVLLAVGLTTLLSHSAERQEAAPPKKAEVLKPKGGRAPRAAPAVQTHTIRVEAEGETICHATIGVRHSDSQPTPCRYEGVETGTRLRLEVTAKGFSPFVDAWDVRRDRVLSLTLLQRAKRIAVAGTRDDEVPVKKRARRTKRQRPSRKRRPAQKKPRAKPIGDGIMTLD